MDKEILNLHVHTEKKKIKKNHIKSEKPHRMSIVIKKQPLAELRLDIQLIEIQ